MKKVYVDWVEHHIYSAEIEIPDNLSPEEELDWVINNTDEWDMHWLAPDEINTDWDSFQVYGVNES